MPVRKSDIKILSSYVARVSSENRPLVEQTIELYKNRKISKFVTAQNIISNLATKNRKKIDEAQKLLVNIMRLSLLLVSFKDNRIRLKRLVIDEL